MKMSMLVALLVLPALLWADSTAEIDHLIAFVRESKAVFIRNGQESTPVAAADHLQKKREHFRKEIKTAEDFIGKAATKSIVSDKPYLVRTEDGQTLESATWLLAELARFRISKAGTTDK